MGAGLRAGLPAPVLGVRHHGDRDRGHVVLGEAVGDHADGGLGRGFRPGFLGRRGCGRGRRLDRRRGRRLGGLGGRCGVAAGLIEHLLDLRGAELGQLGLPRLSQSPEIIVEFVDSDRDPGGLGEIGVPVVAPGAKY